MEQDHSQSIPVDEASAAVAPPTDDLRPRMPEPLPVKLVTIDDANLVAANGLEPRLDAFYVELLGFERDCSDDEVVYRAENFSVIFAMLEPPLVRQDMRILGIEVLSLQQAEQKLIQAGIEYVWQKALNPGQERLLLQDPAGNWIELNAAAQIR
jgi:hypothetical protein